MLCENSVAAQRHKKGNCPLYRRGGWETPFVENCRAEESPALQQNRLR